MTPEQVFVKTLFTKGGRRVVRWPRGYWSRMRERVEVEGSHIRVIDTHPHQPGAVLLDIELDQQIPRFMTYRSSIYPFLDRDLIWSVIYSAVKRFLKSRGQSRG